jgi:hypothetical protein
MFSKLFKSDSLSSLTPAVIDTPKQLNSFNRDDPLSPDRVNEWCGWQGRYSHWIMGLSAGACNVTLFARYRVLFQIPERSTLFYLIPAMVAVSTSLLHEVFVSGPLTEQKISCLSCSIVRSQMIQSVHGFVLPTLAASLTTLYSSLGKFQVPVPKELLEKPQDFLLAFRHIVNVSRAKNVSNTIIALFLINCLVALCFSTLQQNDILRTIQLLERTDNRHPETV